MQSIDNANHKSKSAAAENISSKLMKSSASLLIGDMAAQIYSKYQCKSDGKSLVGVYSTVKETVAGLLSSFPSWCSRRLYIMRITIISITGNDSSSLKHRLLRVLGNQQIDAEVGFNRLRYLGR